MTNGFPPDVVIGDAGTNGSFCYFHSIRQMTDIEARSCRFTPTERTAAHADLATESGRAGFHQKRTVVERRADFAILYEDVSRHQNVAAPPVKARGRGVETSLRHLVTVKAEAGWHARMSSRFAGKGACARCLSGFPTSGFGRCPERNIGAARGWAERRSVRGDIIMTASTPPSAPSRLARRRASNHHGRYL